jgi:hypothetical protein
MSFIVVSIFANNNSINQSNEIYNGVGWVQHQSGMHMLITHHNVPTQPQNPMSKRVEDGGYVVVGWRH